MKPIKLKTKKLTIRVNDNEKWIYLNENEITIESWIKLIQLRGKFYIITISKIYTQMKGV